MRKIVVPVSFGNNAANAARYAADLAIVIGAELHLVYVIPAPGAFSPQPMPEFVFREMRDSGYTWLNDLRNELSKRTEGAVPIYTDLQTGQVPIRLKEVCRKLEPFLVVMGAGESPSEETIDNSNTVPMMHRLSYPLLVVPGGVVFKGIHRIVLACDSEDMFAGGPPMLPFLKELSSLLSAEFEVIHVVTSGEGIGNVIHEYAAWKKQLAALAPLLHVSRQGSVGVAIHHFLQEHPADWLLVLPKKHSVLEFHKSKATEILLQTPIPLISLHEH